MASVYITVGRVAGRAPVTGDTLQVLGAVPKKTVQASTTGSSVPVAGVQAARGEIWTIYAADGPVRVAFGASPDASADRYWPIGQGQSRDFLCEDDGLQNVAVMDL